MTRHGDNGKLLSPFSIKENDMADKILIKGGKLADMPQLSEREIVCATDEKSLYIGINGTNVRVCGAGDKAELELKIDKKLEATASEAQASIDSSTDIAGVITAFNSLVSALKASGIMKEG